MLSKKISLFDQNFANSLFLHIRMGVPINLQSKITTEVQKPITDGDFAILDSFSDQNFISPVVITVKRDQSVKLALDCKF